MTKDWGVKVIAALILLKEGTLAASTYLMALAGKALAVLRFDDVRALVAQFFVLAVAAYFLSSCSTYFLARLKIRLWEDYVLETFGKIKFDQQVGSKKNMEKTIGWLTGEAPSTLSRLCDLYSSSLSIYLNVLFTLLVFWLTLGSTMASALLVSIGASVFIVTIFRRHISKIGKEIQSSKLQVSVSIYPLWGNFLFSNSTMIDNACDNFSTKIGDLQQRSVRYTLFEQAIACTPIYLCVPVIVYGLFNWAPRDAATLGMLVAVLPRSLQLLGNVHGMSLLNTNILLMKSQYEGLRDFTRHLERQNLSEHIEKNKISITDVATGSSMDMAYFIEKVQRRELKGRYRVTGSNGAGKSTLLKLIKSIRRDAILLAPGSQLLASNEHCSTGEEQLRQIDKLLQECPAALLLDEWDANLDGANTKRIDDAIGKVDKTSLVVEVRH